MKRCLVAENEQILTKVCLKDSLGRLSALPAMGSAPKSFLVIADPILYDLFR